MRLGIHLGIHIVSSGDSLLFTVVIHVGQKYLALKAFVDSGAAGNFLDLSAARSLGMSTVLLEVPIVMRGLDGQPLSTGLIQYKTPPIRLQVGSIHQEEIEFFLIDCSSVPLVLGNPWLVTHNPIIDWNVGEVVRWSQACVSKCISRPIRVCAVSSTNLPPQYADFTNVFCKNKADVLPPHRPYDCAIDLYWELGYLKGGLLSLRSREPGD